LWISKIHRGRPGLKRGDVEGLNDGVQLGRQGGVVVVVRLLDRRPLLDRQGNVYPGDSKVTNVHRGRLGSVVDEVLFINCVNVAVDDEIHHL
jgi:hypothetical protein